MWSRFCHLLEHPPINRLEVKAVFGGIFVGLFILNGIQQTHEKLIIIGRVYLIQELLCNFYISCVSSGKQSSVDNSRMYLAVWDQWKGPFSPRTRLLESQKLVIRKVGLGFREIVNQFTE